MPSQEQEERISLIKTIAGRLPGADVDFDSVSDPQMLDALLDTRFRNAGCGFVNEQFRLDLVGGELEESDPNVQNLMDKMQDFDACDKEEFSNCFFPSSK